MIVSLSGPEFVTRKLCDISDSRGGETDAARSFEMLGRTHPSTTGRFPKDLNVIHVFLSQ